MLVFKLYFLLLAKDLPSTDGTHVLITLGGFYLFLYFILEIGLAEGTKLFNLFILFETMMGQLKLFLFLNCYYFLSYICFVLFKLSAELLFPNNENYSKFILTDLSQHIVSILSSAMPNLSCFKSKVSCVLENYISLSLMFSIMLQASCYCCMFINKVS